MRITILIATFLLAACTQEPAPLAKGEATVIDGQIDAYHDARKLEQDIQQKVDSQKQQIDQQIAP